ncbi:hypothetical protein GGR88_001804 [Sphingomonas jejuensis]|uniref:Ice-binding protein C-terminal domain-containing protein n=1 Tax=Sphingomonas jejuensis TaxID=904715 RepID=A0ABX0XM42_9SPHN|nr:PEPxxWA-CTERM sorting domain-containing protein [Sphingomonas jejuensis]NJC34330.1 hypothetical protein [Sphingomonas jejuensis]
MKQVLLAGAAMLCAAAPASAATFTFTAAGTGLTAAGTFTTTDTTTTVDGRQAFTITGLTGTFNGQAITSLLPAGTDIGGERSDNLLFGAQPFFTIGGVAFRVDGYDADLNFYSFAGVGEAFFSANVNGMNETLPPLPVAGTPVTFTLERVAAVPEPATWAMMIGGFALVGGLMRRRPVAVAA